MKCFGVVGRGALLCFLLIASAQRLAAQDGGPDPARIGLTRTDLTALLSQYVETAQSAAYSGELRARAAREAQLIRERLEQGDFQVGDQVALDVEGEDVLSASFVVEDGPALALPIIGKISLRGVLRSELNQHLQGEVAKYIRDPVVRARSSVRIVVTGAVGKAGYHVVPSDIVFSDVLAVAGGTTPNANLGALAVERGDQRIWEGEPLQRVIIEGRTLDQLGIRAGDEVVVPEQPGGSRVWRVLQPVLAIVSPLALLIRVFF